MSIMKIRLNDDTDLVKEIIQQLRDNDGYCPCRLSKTPETKCMCKEFRDQDIGICHCGLYEKYKVEEDI